MFFQRVKNNPEPLSLQKQVWICPRARVCPPMPYATASFLQEHACFSVCEEVSAVVRGVAAAGKSLQSCPTLRPHSRQPTRLPCPWDSPGKNTGVGCHFLLQCVKVKSESEVAQSCPTLSDSMDCSPSGSSIHGTFRARILEWDAIAFSDM